jgi:hypothetical protein
LNDHEFAPASRDKGRATIHHGRACCRDRVPLSPEIHVDRIILKANPRIAGVRLALNIDETVGRDREVSARTDRVIGTKAQLHGVPEDVCDAIHGE